MDIKDIAIRLILAIVIGGVIGYNREYENRPAGFRTHVLVCLGATVASLIQVQLGYFIADEIVKTHTLNGILHVDSGRVICQVISGIGFLGAGTIIQTKGAVKGLTTAASIWAVGCVGIAIGMGFYEISILSGVSIVVVLVLLKKFEGKFIVNTKQYSFLINFNNKREATKYINNYFEINNIRIKDIEYIGEMTYLYVVNVPQFMNLNDMISSLIIDDNIISIKEYNNKNVKD